MFQHYFHTFLRDKDALGLSVEPIKEKMNN